MKKLGDPYVSIDHRIRRAGISPGAYFAYATLRETAWEVGSQYFRGVQFLADECGVSRQTISAWLGELDAVRAISILRNPGPRKNDVITITDPDLLDPESLVAHRDDVQSKRRASRQGRLTADSGSAVKPHLRLVKSDVQPQVKQSCRQSSHAVDGSREEEDRKNLEKHEEAVPGGRRGRSWDLINGDLVISDDLKDTIEARIILGTVQGVLDTGVAGGDVMARLRPLVQEHDDPSSAVDAVVEEFRGSR